MDAIEELIKKSTNLYHTDSVFYALVEQSVMVAFSHQVIPVSSDTMTKVREALRISAGVALLLNEYEETKTALERKGFTGVTTIKDLATGDFRDHSHIVGINENHEESFTKNEVIVYIECQGETVAHKPFSRLAEHDEIENWINTILTEHKKTCPILTQLKEGNHGAQN